jgi:hypothetical protein
MNIKRKVWPIIEKIHNTSKGLQTKGYVRKKGNVGFTICDIKKTGSRECLTTNSQRQ